MIKKLTFKEMQSTAFALFFCLLFAVPMLWINGPAALEGLNGSVPELAKKQSMDTTYFVAVLGLLFLALAVFILIRQLTHTVKKRVGLYLEKNPSVTIEQLDSEFEAAEKVGGVWVGKQHTFSSGLNDVVLDNDKIVWVYTETMQVKRRVNYFICFGMLDGKIDRVGSSMNECRQLEEIYGGMSHVVVGNSPEYGYMYKNDKAAFLDIKYRKKAEPR